MRAKKKREGSFCLNLKGPHNRAFEIADAPELSARSVLPV
jgi:hypothetical protein